MPVAPRCILLASLVALGHAAASRAEPPRPRLVHGQVLFPDGGSPLGLRARIIDGAEADTFDIRADGSFTLRLTGVRCDSVEIGIDSGTGSLSRYHPTSVRIASSRFGEHVPAMLERLGPHPELWEPDPLPPDSVRVVLVPRRFTIEGGTYTGRSIPIAASAALGAAGRRGRFWRVSRSGREPARPVAWPEGSFPLDVALHTGGGITEADTAAFWVAARQLERDLGLALFRPAARDAIASDAWRVAVRIVPASAEAGTTFLSWGGLGVVTGASIELRTAALLHDEHIVTHELLHTLGVGHSPWRPSVMGAARDTVSRATPEDVAHTQLLYRLLRAHVDGRATHGLGDVAAASDRGDPATACAAVALVTSPPP